MGCRKGCGSSTGNIELIVKDLIRQMIEDGALQEGLIDCNGGRLYRNHKVLTCELVSAAICQLADEGLLCFKEPESIVLDDDGHICILFNDGTKTCTKRSIKDRSVQSGATDGTNLKLTMSDGSIITIDLLNALKTVTATAVESDTGYTITGTDKKSVTIPKVSIKENNNGTSTVTIGGNTYNVVSKAVSAKTNNDGSVTITLADGSTYTTAAKATQLTAGAGIKIENGVIKNIYAGCTDISDLNILPFTQEGTYCIKGNEKTLNLPNGLFQQDGPEASRGTSTGDWSSSATYDWVGTVTISSNETSVTIQNGKTIWTSSNDVGFTPGSTVPTTGWSDWQRMDNIPCTQTITTKSDNYTLAKSDQFVQMSGTKTLTLPSSGIEVGQTFTVVNTDAGTTTLAGVAGVTIIPPYKGSLKITGTNAAVTIVKTSATQYRVFGNTAAA